MNMAWESKNDHGQLTMFKLIRNILVLVVISIASIWMWSFYTQFVRENKILKEVISRLEAESRVAEVLVTGVNFDEKTNSNRTTIKFLEYDFRGKPLAPRYFTFTGNVIQFQSLVIRFNDIYIRNGDKLKGKSAYIFWKVFMLDGSKTQEFEITPLNSIPDGYKIQGAADPFEEKLWQNFWAYALEPDRAQKEGIKNAQIEAPGTVFVSGNLYTIIIEHDGGLRIDSKPLSPILQGEKF